MKNFKDNEELQKDILNGVNKLADAVGSTMGPRGRTVMLSAAGQNPVITKDGVSVARFTNFENPFENAAANVIKEAAEMTNQKAGDGTTTSSVLARAILITAHKYMAAGHPAIEIKRGIDECVKHLVGAIKQHSRPISSLDEIINIATVSANGDSVVGKIIGEAVDSVGKDGSITIKEGGANETTVEIVEGFRFDSGIVSAKFITNKRTNSMKYENPRFLITDQSIEQISQIYPALELAARDKKPLIIVAEDIVGEALAALIMNITKGTIKVAAIKAPSFGSERKEILSDLALTVGATFFSEEFSVGEPRSIESVKLQDLGRAESIESSRYNTVIVNGVGTPESIQERLDSLEKMIEQSSDLRECEKFQNHIVRLVSSIAIIHVGGLTQTENIEKKHRIEDALEAVRSAQSEGIVLGAGVSLIRCRDVLDSVVFSHPEQEVSRQIMKEVCEAPLRQILANAGKSFDVVLLKLSEFVEEEDKNKVYDLLKEEYVDAFESGVIDPAKVLRCALENAASAAGSLITTNYAIIES